MNLILMVLCVTEFVDLSFSQDDGSADENRPYKFGFNIEGYQHRYEEKDEKGIIMGEYGFITGDGVYHLTVYATDENGNFKIVRTKNVYIGLPGEKTTTPVPAISSLRPERVREITEKAVTMVQGIAGCGGCLIPTTAAPQIDVSSGVEPLRGSPVGRLVAAKAGGIPGDRGPAEVSLEGQPGQPEGPDQRRPGPVSQQGPGAVSQPGPQLLAQRFGPSQPDPQSPAIRYSPDPGPLASPPSGPNAGKTLPSPGPRVQDTTSPVNKLMTNVPKMTSQIQNMEDLQALFYIFNYTLTYHGHHETGNRRGDKNGSYFFNGRDGLGRNVTYVANEFGYQPNITLYDLTEDQTPNELTEKDQTKLLGNEFRWFYGKQDSNSTRSSKK